MCNWSALNHLSQLVFCKVVWFSCQDIFTLFEIWRKIIGYITPVRCLQCLTWLSIHRLIRTWKGLCYFQQRLCKCYSYLRIYRLYLPIFFRVHSLVLRKSYHCPSGSEIILQLMARFPCFSVTAKQSLMLNVCKLPLIPCVEVSRRDG